MLDRPEELKRIDRCYQRMLRVGDRQAGGISLPLVPSIIDTSNRT